MRVALLAVALLPSSLFANDPLTNVMTQQPAAVVEAPPIVVEEQWLTSHRKQPVFGMDIMLGQQSGLRANLTVHSTERTSLVIEGFYGGLFTRLGQSEGAGAGVRWNISHHGCDAVTFGPGLDVFFNFQDGEAIFLAPTVDLAWRHNFGERSCLMLGINAGIGIGVSGTVNGDEYYRPRRRPDAAGKVTPLISVFGGLRF